MMLPSFQHWAVCLCVCVCLFSMCVCISENVTAYQCATCVSTDMWEQCECVRWLSPPLHSESRSLKPHERVCGRQNDKARNQPASACSHTQTRTYSYLHICHTYPSTYWHILSRTLSLSHSLPNTHKFNTNHHYTTSPVQRSPFRPRMPYAAEMFVFAYFLTDRHWQRTERKIGFLR